VYVISKEELDSTIAAARYAAKIKRRATIPSREWWDEIRDAEVTPAFDVAVRALNDASIRGKVERKNGGSGIALRAGSDFARHLTFTHAPEVDGLRVSSSESTLDETWDDRGHATDDTVGAKVREFVGLIAADYPEKRGPLQIGRP